MARRRARSADPDAPPPRRMRGFEAAATLLAPRLRQGAESRGFAVARLLTHWPEIVGAATAAHTRPVKVAHGKEFGATLTILTDGAHAPLVQMELPRIRDKVNAVYGFNAIARVAVTQTAPQGFAEGQAEFRPAPRVARAPAPETVAAAGQVAARFEDPALAEAMHALTINRAARDQRRLPLPFPLSPSFPDRKAPR
ncbi:DUF721 domain-containing protein [Paracoccus sphaerophysae]|uniref:DUF721 domain-containing protein n=1 Tax=Paracoccus sphaerophysae TaxID=690417 RepID=UPI002355E585|nr:DUF721 domain-containing protein [Paracoccus sphaerophysae]